MVGHLNSRSLATAPGSTAAFTAQANPGENVPGAHPVYGGRNWGVSFSTEWGDFTVNHGYYGSHEDKPRRFDGVEIPDDLPLWCCDQSHAVDADWVWDHRDQINDALRERGIGAASFTVPAQFIFPASKGAVRLGIKTDFELTGHWCTLTVRPYDNPALFEPFTITTEVHA